MTDDTTFTPGWASPPGDTIVDLLEERGWTQTEFAARTGYTTKHVNDLIQGRAHIQAETAERLSLVLGSTPAFWMVRDAQFRAAQEATRAHDNHLADAGWLKELPLRWMVKLRWIRHESHKGRQVAECLRFFRTASVEAWREQYTDPLVAFRASATIDKDLGAVATWLRRAEIEADAIETASFDRDGFRDSLNSLRALTREADPTAFAPQLVDACARNGVAVVFVPAPPGCPVSGATRFLGADRALLALSLRHRSNDHFWFTFFHEAAHLILHGKKLRFIEGFEPHLAEFEAEADRFARDRLVPPPAAKRLSRLRTDADVRALADEIGVAPGILVGRMQNEHWVGCNRMNHLRVRYSWGEFGVEHVAAPEQR